MTMGAILFAAHVGLVPRQVCFVVVTVQNFGMRGVGWPAHSQSRKAATPAVHFQAESEAHPQPHFEIPLFEQLPQFTCS
jgi:hypothetical protein